MTATISPSAVTRLVLIVGCLMAAAPAAGQSGAWPEPAKSADKAPAPRPEPGRAKATQPSKAPAPAPEAVATNPGYLGLPQLVGYQRYFLYAAAFLAAYCLPLILFFGLLRSGRDPGTAAAICLLLGVVFIGTPLLMWLVAREAFNAGVPIPFYLQTDRYMAFVGALVLVFSGLAFVAWRSKGSTHEDWA